MPDKYLEASTDGETDIYTHRLTYRQTYRHIYYIQTDILKNRQSDIYIETDILTDKQTHRNAGINTDKQKYR